LYCIVLFWQGVAEALPGADGVIDMHAFILEKGDAGNNEMHLKDRAEKGVVPVAVHAGYRTLSTAEIGQYLVAMPAMRRRLGLASDMSAAEEGHFLSQLEIIEVGDGNLNLVYLVHGPERAGTVMTVVVKQALPYVRCVGESWPLTLARADFEQAALVIQRGWDAAHVPEVYHFNRKLSMFVMEYIPPPHTILRKLLMEGGEGAGRPVTFAEDLSTFLANTLFNTSALAMSGGKFRETVSKWSTNTAMCALTEQVSWTLSCSSVGN
jgi:5-methylthioribose kinase